MKTEKKSTWGGARRSGITKKQLTVQVDKEIAEKLPERYSRLINGLLKKYFSENQNKS